MRNNEVARAWADGHRASSGNMSTDGVDLFSYNLLIGSNTGGQRSVLNYTASGQYRSQTTSTHVGIALGVCGGTATLVQP